ncbi:hypothetical protein GQ53DRAFT_520427 [Thozetella sp. PMI_491]|nr:hypothetical protein GQ53DRAFT_520427 [Thozetella sp. PMI_491]
MPAPWEIDHNEGVSSMDSNEVAAAEKAWEVEDTTPHTMASTMMGQVHMASSAQGTPISYLSDPIAPGHWNNSTAMETGAPAIVPSQVPYAALAGVQSVEPYHGYVTTQASPPPPASNVSQIPLHSSNVNKALFTEQWAAGVALSSASLPQYGAPAPDMKYMYSSEAQCPPYTAPPVPMAHPAAVATAPGTRPAAPNAFRRLTSAVAGWSVKKKLFVFGGIVLVLLAIIIGGAVGGTVTKNNDKKPNCGSKALCTPETERSICGKVYLGYCNYDATPNTYDRYGDSLYGCCSHF